MKDFFVSYNRHDRAWAEWIAWTLEAAGYETVIQAWDFRAGGNFVLDMQTAASEAKRTIAVLSENYLGSQFTQPEWAAAFAQDPTGEKHLLIPIRVSECTLSGMWAPIVYVDVVGIEETTAQDLVLQAVQTGRSKPEQKPNFPGRSESITDRAKPIYPPNIMQNLPYGSQNFVGREAELAQIHEQLQQRSTTVILAISGMGGTGKTELVLQYARQHCYEGSYPGGVCWLRAREDVGTQIISFVRSCLELVPPEDLKLVEKVRWCWGRWREGAALLIFDDVQQYDDVAPFLPPQDSRFKVLLTTRSHFGSPVQSLPLGVLSEATALALLRSLVERDRVDQQLAQAKQLCEWLGYLPLGVELVGRYLARKPDLSLTVLWQRLQDKKLDAIAFKQAEPGMTASLGVAAAFELSWQALDESTQQVAAVLSLFALVEIPWTLVEQCLPTLDTEELEEIRDQQLLGTHLLKRVEQGMYQLHQLLREFFAAKREQMADADAMKQAFCQVMVAVADLIPQTPILSLLEQITPTIPHLKEAATTFVPWLTDADLITPSTRLGWFYEGQSAHIEAEQWHKRCLTQAETRLGADHPTMATSMNNLAGLYYTQGRYSEAESLSQQALALRQHLLGDEHPDSAQSLSNLAGVYYAKGHYSNAEPLLLKALTVYEQQLGSDHPDVAISLNSLAVLYYAQGRYAEAEPLRLRCLEIQKQALGEDHPQFAMSLNSLAVLYYAQGRYAEAEPLRLRCLEIQKQALGEDHPQFATSLNNLAVLYHAQGRYSEAESLCIRALTISEQQLGSNHPDVATRLGNLALLYYAQGRYSEAEPLCIRALTISEQQLGSNHPDVATGLGNLAGIYQAQGRYAEAEPLYTHARDIYVRQLGEDHPHVLSSLSNLAGIYQAQGRYAEAERFYMQALPILWEKLGDDHPTTNTIWQNFCGFLQKAIQEQRTDELSDDPMTRGVLRELGGEG